MTDDGSPSNPSTEAKTGKARSSGAACPFSKEQKHEIDTAIMPSYEKLLGKKINGKWTGDIKERTSFIEQQWVAFWEKHWEDLGQRQAIVGETLRIPTEGEWKEVRLPPLCYVIHSTQLHA